MYIVVFVRGLDRLANDIGIARTPALHDTHDLRTFFNDATRERLDPHPLDWDIEPLPEDGAELKLRAPRVRMACRSSSIAGRRSVPALAPRSRSR